MLNLDISSVMTTQDFDGWMVQSDGELMTITLMTGRPLLQCEMCDESSDRVYLIAPARPQAASAVQQCQKCLHEATQTTHMSGDIYLAPLCP